MFSFNRNKERLQASHALMRIVDLTTPNLATVESDRAARRHNRSLPVLVAPWDGQHAVTDGATVAITKDFSDNGLSIILAAPCGPTAVALGYWLPGDASPRFFLGETRQSVELGGGFWQVGVRVHEALTCARTFNLLEPLAEQLRTSPACSAEPAGTHSGSSHPA